MFRRKRASSQAPVNSNPSPSAQTAAVQAFRASRAASSNLSSAAAAAALRKHPTSPTSVEDVQTKRTLQRQLSVSSAGSATASSQGGGQDGALRRSRSSGSMTTRSFRDNSQAPIGPVVRQDEVIPVPPIPQAYAPAPSSHHRRAASLQPPFRGVSSPNREDGMRGSSLDRSPEQWRLDNTGATRSTKSPELERQGSRAGSINFSYPMNARPNSPPQVSSPEPRRMEDSSHYGSYRASPPPVRPTKEDPAIRQDQSARTLRTQTDSPNISAQKAAGSRSSSKDSHAGAGSDIAQRRQVAEGAAGRQLTVKTDREPLNVQATDTRSQVARTPTDTRDLRVPKKRPSIVHEETEYQDRTRDKSPQSQHNKTEDTSPLQEQFPKPTSEQHSLQDRNGSFNHRGAPNETHSPSPKYATRFSDHLEVVYQGDHLHEPPPRSMSPGKPALKCSTSRSRSPKRTDIQHARATEAPSETSEGTSVLSEEVPTPRQKKKTAKVSFEDGAERLAHTASPPTSMGSSEPSSPQSTAIPKTSSQGAGQNGVEGSHNVDGFDEVLKPRPTLPSFGSVRGRKPFVEERSESHHPSKLDNDNRPAAVPSFSNDHAVGSLLTDAGSKEASSNGRPASNLPLPPEVTSVEGTGYGYSSDESSDSDEVADPRDFIPPGVDIYSSPTQGRTGLQTNDIGQGKETYRDQPVTNGQEQNLEVVPTISVQPATPGIEELAPGTEWAQLPGSFPQQGHMPATSARYSEQDNAAKQLAAENEDGDYTSTQVGTANVVSAAADDNDDSSGSGESIYSDAAEDLSELDGDGFGSINAIVESPVSKSRKSTRPAPSSPLGFRQESVDTRKPNGVGQFDSDLRSTSPWSESNDSPVGRTEQASQSFENQSDVHSQAHDPSLHVQTTPTSTEYVNKPAHAIDHQEQQALQLGEPSQNMERMPASRPRNFGQEDPQAMQQRTAFSPGHSKKDKKAPGASSVGPVPARGAAKALGKSGLPDKELSSSGPLQRTLSNGSDSSSSFKRERRSPQATGRYTLRRTMRDSGDHGRSHSDALAPSAEFSTSPNRRQAFSSEGGQSMLRTTMRGSPNGTQGKSSIFSSSGNPAKPKAFPGRNIFQNAGKKTEDKGKTPFRGRFDDSSDDEYEMSKLRPVRGIPRRRDEEDGESTELDDSSENDGQRNVVRSRRSSRARPAAAKTPANVAAPAETTDANASGVSTKDDTADLDYFLRENRKQRTGLLNRLNLSKSKSRRNEETRIRKSELESAARRDTPLERSRLDLERTRATTPTTTTTVTPSPASPSNKRSPLSSKLQKRVSHRIGSGSWPFQSNKNEHPETLPSIREDGGRTSSFPLPTKASDAHRPHTSDGVIENGGPGISTNGKGGDSPQPKRLLSRLNTHGRHETGGTLDSNAPKSPLSDSGRTSMGTMALKGGERKNRFPMLRKALGLKQ